MKTSQPDLLKGKKQKEEMGKSALVQLVKRGVDADAVFLIAERSGLHKETIAHLLETSLKTLRRYQKEHKKLNAKESELILKLADLFERGEQVFGNMAEFRHWIEAPAYGLDNQVPLELLYTSEGINLVLDEVERIAHGDLA